MDDLNRVAIIVSAGEGTRWGKYMGIDKSDVVIEKDEPILRRTIRQVQAHGADVAIYSKKRDVYGFKTNPPQNKPEWGEANKLFSCLDSWNENGRTIILFGDTYFTEGAIDKIMQHDKNGFWVFGRPFDSKTTGKPYGEIYALSFYPEDKERLLFALNRVSKLEERGVIEKANVWAVYRAMLKLPDDIMHEHIVGSNFVNIDDWTEDFDYPHDYDVFMQKWREAGMGN